MQNKSHHGFGCCYPFASDYHSYSLEIPCLIWWQRSSLHKIWDNNNKRLLHNLNETYVYNFQNFFFKKLRAQIILHLKNEVLPLSKLSLFNSNEDQQKNSSSFVNTSWYPVKWGHYFYNAWNIPLRLMFNYWSLLPCSNFVIISLTDSFWR